jgi:hypothetical protein
MEEAADTYSEFTAIGPKITSGLHPALPDNAGSQMILEMLANTRQVEVDPDTNLVEDILGSNTRVHEDLGATHGASGEDDLLVDANDVSGSHIARSCVPKLEAVSNHQAFLISHCHPSAICKAELGDTGLGDDVQVVPLRQRINVRGSRVAPRPVGLADTAGSDETAKRNTTVGCLERWHTSSVTSGRPIAHSIDHDARIAELHRSTTAMVLRADGKVVADGPRLGKRSGKVFRLLHHLEHVVPVPEISMAGRFRV